MKTKVIIDPNKWSKLPVATKIEYINKHLPSISNWASFELELARLISNDFGYVVYADTVKNFMKCHAEKFPIWLENRTKRKMAR